MALLQKFKQSACTGATVGVAVGTVAAVAAGAYIINQHSKALKLHNQAIMLNTSAILALSTHVAKQRSNNA